LFVRRQKIDQSSTHLPHSPADKGPSFWRDQQHALEEYHGDGEGAVEDKMIMKLFAEMRPGLGERKGERASGENEEGGYHEAIEEKKRTRREADDADADAIPMLCNAR
jgi:hypothetical protein